MSALFLMQDYEGEKAGAIISRRFADANKLVRLGIAVRVSEMQATAPAVPEVVVPDAAGPDPVVVEIDSDPTAVTAPEVTATGDEDKPKRRRRKSDDLED